MINLISALTEERDGYSLDKPWRLNEVSLNVVIPILRQSAESRLYLTLPEARQIKVKDSGQINFVQITNNEQLPLLVCRGSIFAGKTQNRAVIHDTFVMPSTSVRVAVRCVHQSHPITSKADMKYSGSTPYQVNLSSQGKAWETVGIYCSSVGASTSFRGRGQSVGNPSTKDIQATTKWGDYSNYPSYTTVPPQIASADLTGQLTATLVDNLLETKQQFSQSIKDILQSIPFLDNQVGVIFFRENTLSGLELFNHQLSWKALKDDVIEKEGHHFKQQDDGSLFELKPENTNNAVAKALSNLKQDSIFSNKDYNVVKLENDKVLGEGIIFNGVPTHLSLWAKN